MGFERRFTSVNESVGSFELCVRIFNNATLLLTDFEFSLDLVSNANTAGT